MVDEFQARIEELRARKEKNWAQSDGLRAKLLDLGVLVEDSVAGQKLKRRAGV